MGSYLVVANQTLGGPELKGELRKRLEAGASSFYVLVPNTHAVDYHGVPAAGGFVPMPTLVTAGPATNEEATAQAQYRLDQLLSRLRDLGVKAEGELGDADPLKAIEKVVANRQFDEIILSTLPHPVSKWLRTDLPHHVERRFALPVTTVIARG